MWLGGLGVLVSSFAGELDAIEALHQLTGPWAPIAMITVVLSTLPVSAMNLYGGALSLLTIRVPVSRIGGVIIASVLSLLIALWMQTDPYGSFYDFLNLLAYLVVPFSTILLLDYHLRSKKLGSAATQVLFDQRRHIEWGFVAWVIGCAASALFWSTEMWQGPLAEPTASWGDLSFAVGAVTAVASYLVFQKFPQMHRSGAVPNESFIAGKEQ